MPTPETPWIAVDYGQLTTSVALKPENTRSIETITFYNAFLYDANSDKISICEHPNTLSPQDSERLFVVNLSNIKANEKFTLPGTEIKIPYVSLLKTALTHVKSVCEKSYFQEGDVSTCFFVCGDADNLRNCLTEAAKESGFTQVEFRDKGTVAINAISLARPLENYVALCDLSYGYVSLTLFQKLGDGYAPIDAKHKGVDPAWSYLGLEFMLNKLSEKTIKRRIAASPNDTDFEKFKIQLELQFAKAVQIAGKTGSDYKGECAGRRFLFVKNDLERRWQNYFDSLRQVLFEPFFAEIGSVLQRKSYEIVAIGPGAVIPFVKNSLADASGVPCRITLLDEQNAAEDWVKLLFAMETLPINASPTQIQYASIYREAMRGNVKSFLELAKCFGQGFGTIYSKEEAFYWLRRAGLEGDVDALYKLAKSYELGWGTQQNQEKAYEFYYQAAMRGLAKAQYKLARILLANRQNEQAAYWLELAMKQGDRRATEDFKKFDFASTLANSESLRRPAVQPPPLMPPTLKTPDSDIEYYNDESRFANKEDGKSSFVDTEDYLTATSPSGFGYEPYESFAPSDSSESFDENNSYNDSYFVNSVPDSGVPDQTGKSRVFTVLGLILATLVFVGGALFIERNYHNGEAQTQAARIVVLINLSCAFVSLFLGIVFFFISLLKRRNT